MKYYFSKDAVITELSRYVNRDNGLVIVGVFLIGYGCYQLGKSVAQDEAIQKIDTLNERNDHDLY